MQLLGRRMVCTVGDVRARRQVGAARAVVLSALVLAGACSGDGGRDGAGPEPTVPPGGRSTTTSSSVSTTLDPSAYDVPATIDQAYVQRVVSAYDHVLGDAIRALKRDGGLSDDFLKHLLAIYTEQEFEAQQRGWRSALAQGDLGKRPDVPGNPVTSVVTVNRADPKCITAQVSRDFRPTLRPDVTPSESPQPDYVVLVRKHEGRDPLASNSTPWVMAFDGFKNDGSVPVNSCED
jgi:hypothetical protein